MSKKLLKILAICIFVTLIPVAIVAIAITATQSAPYTINVELKGEEEQLNEYEQNLSISVNERLRSGSKVGVKETDKVVITFNGDAYDVKGFYQGNPESISESSQPLELNVSSYDFEVKGSANITIWVQPKTFELSFKLVNGETEISDLNTSYGEELPKVQGRDDFAGWMVEGANDNKIYQKATFDTTGEYTLVPKYSEDMTLKYYKDGQLILEKVVYEHNYNDYDLLNSDDPELKDFVDFGYEFESWTIKNEAGDIVYVDKPEFKADAVYSLYLNENLLEYSADVKFNINSDTYVNVDFNIEDGFIIKDVTREYYTLSGIIYKDKEYNIVETDFVLDGQSLLEVLIEDCKKGEDISQKLTFVWESQFGSSYTFYIYLRTIDGAVYRDKSAQDEVEKFEITLNFDGSETYDLNSSLADLYINTFDVLYDSNGKEIFNNEKNTVSDYTVDIWPGQAEAFEGNFQIVMGNVKIGYLISLIENADTGIDDIIIRYILGKV